MVDRGKGIDTFSISQSTLQAVTVATQKGAANTEVDIEGSTVRGKTNIKLDTSTDTNTVNISSSDFNAEFSLTTSTGGDDVDLETSTFEKSATMSLGKGGDGLTLRRDVFQGAVNFDGGPGANLLSDNGTSVFLGQKTIKNFTNI